MQGITYNDLKDFKCLGQFHNHYNGLGFGIHSDILRGQLLSNIDNFWKLPLELQIGVFLAWFKEEGLEYEYTGSDLVIFESEEPIAVNLYRYEIAGIIIATFAHIDAKGIIDKREQ